MKNYLKYKLYNIFSSSLFYISALIFNIFVSGQFFFVQKFFGGSGTTDLHYFFHAVPLISAIMIPLLKLNENFSSFDEIVPLCTTKKIFVSWFSLFIQFAVILFPQFLVPLCVNLFGDVEIGQVFSGFLMLLFYGAISASLCVFFSQICRSQVVSVIISILVLSVLNGINLFSVYAGNIPFFSAIIKIFSFYWHFDAAEKGILDTRDLIYFSTVSAFLVFVSIIFAESKKGKRILGQEKKRIILVFGCAIFLLLDSTRFYARFDFTKGNKYSISRYSKKLAEEASEKVEISFFQSKSLSNYYPEARNILDLLKEYSAQKNISVKFYNTDNNENAKKN
ncbi:MAG: Gldg family protein [Treponema sp.]|nr:Gldg family protein [Treponema sp.]